MIEITLTALMLGLFPPAPCPGPLTSSPQQWPQGTTVCTVWQPDGVGHFTCSIDNDGFIAAVSCYR